MQRKPLRRLWSAMLGLCLSVLAGMASAETVHLWEAMLPGAFPATNASAHEQSCSMNLTKAECDEYVSDLEAGEFKTVMVPDNVQYSQVSFKRNGKHEVQGRTLKLFGSEAPVREVRLSTGRIVHWYTGFPRACNNVALDPVDLNPPRRNKTGVKYQWTAVDRPTVYHHVSPFLVPNEVYIPGITFRDAGAPFIVLKNWPHQ